MEPEAAPDLPLRGPSQPVPQNGRRSELVTWIVWVTVQYVGGALSAFLSLSGKTTQTYKPLSHCQTPSVPTRI